MDMLGLNKLHQALAAMCAAAAAVLKTAPRRLADAVRVEHLIYADRPRLYLFGNAAPFCKVARPDACGQAKLAVVCKPHGLILSRKGRDGQRRPKGFLLHGEH